MKANWRQQVLQEWQPLAAADSGCEAAKARPVAELVPKLMRRLGLEQRLQQSQIYHRWAEIVGEEVARHAQPVGLRQGVLQVRVDHPVWLQELSRYHKALLLQKIQQRFGSRLVREISFRIG